MKVLRIPGYLPFCAYCFLLMLFTGACPMIFSLMEKDVLGFSDDRIVLIGNLMALGGMLGFVLGGRMVDRFGTKYVFLCCHLRIQRCSAFGSDPGNTDDFPALFDGIINRSFRDDPGGFRNRDDLRDTFPHNLGKQIPFDRFVDDALHGWYRTFRNSLQPTP